MEFWLMQGKEKLQLPVPPPNYQVTKAMNNSTELVENVGEVSFLGRAKLVPITLASFFPAKEYSFCRYSGFPAPYECVKLIEDWQKSCKPIRFIITGAATNMLCSIESFVYGEEDGTGDIKFQLELREYKVLGNTEMMDAMARLNAALSVVGSRASSKETAKTYTVKAGETLYDIAKRELGSAEKYVDLVTKNALKNANLIIIGQVLQL